MTQAEFDAAQLAEKEKTKKTIAAYLAQAKAVRAFFKANTLMRKAQLEVTPASAEKKAARSAYSIHRHLSHKLREMKNLQGWNVKEAEVKFNNKGDLLLFEIAIPFERTAESPKTSE